MFNNESNSFLFYTLNKKKSLIDILNKLFYSYGYNEISTPAFEDFDVFSNVPATIKKNEMFKFIGTNGNVLVLRPDLTIPIAKIVSKNYEDLIFPVKLFYVSDVFRFSNDASSVDNSFIQAGIEFLGDNTIDADGEVIALAIKSLLKVSKSIKIDIGQSDFIKGLVEEIKVDKKDIETIISLIENKNTDELTKFVNKLKIEGKVKESILGIPHLYGDFEGVITEAKNYCLNNMMSNALVKLEEVYKVLNDYDLIDYLSLDLGMITNLDYYTGIIFKGYINNYGKEVLTGGRYDSLTENFGVSIPATGFGINVDNLLKTIKEDDDSINNKKVILYFDLNSRKKALELGDKLRDKNILVDLRSINNEESQIENIVKNSLENVLVLKEDVLNTIDYDLEEREITVNQFIENINEN